MDHDHHIVNLIESAGELIDYEFDIGGLEPIGQPDFKDDVLDSTLKYTLPGVRSENDAILIVSQQAYPDSVEEAVVKSQRARSALSADLASVILEPVVDGRHNGLSFAIWPKHTPLSNARLARAFQKRRLNPRVFAWLHAAAADSMHRSVDDEEVDHCFRTPLKYMAANEKQSDQIRSTAAEALQHLDSGTWSTITHLQHSDFWLGNILLARDEKGSADNRFGFYVIDWGGSLINGMPVFDLVRYCMSTGVSLQAARREILRYTQATYIRPDELAYYLIIALGRIGMDLRQFPESRYLEMCSNTTDYMRAVGIKP